MDHFKKNFDFFQDYCDLTDGQLKLFERYAELLVKRNEETNLTAKTTVPGIIKHLFQDSLMLAKKIDLKKTNSIADVGTGAGFPGIPLKIVYPHLKLTLIEVNTKKIRFLQEVVEELSLFDVQICDLDWRTFNRITDFDIDFFVSKAALEDVEMIRMFRSTSRYKDKFLVYWASQLWEPQAKAEPFVIKDLAYKNVSRAGRFVVFGSPDSCKLSVITKL